MFRLLPAICCSFAVLLPLYPARAAVSGKLDIDSGAHGFIMRDIKNGQWRGGYNKNLFTVNLNDKELVSFGYNHTWNTEKGNSALGISAGKHVALAQVGSLLNLSDLTMPPFLQYIGKVTSLNGVVAYMPLHTKDVDGPVIYGAGVELDLSDIFQILTKGL